MDYFTLFLNGFCLAMQGGMHFMFVSRLTGKTVKIRHIALYLSLLAAFEWIAGKVSLPWITAILGELFILYAVSRFSLKNQRMPSLTGAVLALYISQLSFGIVNSAESVLFPYLVGKPFLYAIILLATALSLTICACCCIAALRSLSLEDAKLTPDNEPFLFPAFLLPVLFFFAAELYIMQTSYTNTVSVGSSLTLSLSEAGKHISLLVLQALGLGALFCTLYAYRRICHGLQAQVAFRSLAQAARAQKTYVAEAKARYQQTKSFRHDIKNHLSVLNGLLTSGKSEEAASYLQSLSIASDSLSFPFQTGNSAADILLSEKLALAEADGIATEVSLVLPDSWGIDDFDLCVIFANALDNAVNACKAFNGEKSIHVSGARQGDFYMLKFKNTCPENSFPDGFPPAGTGLSNIRTVAEKYHGAMLAEKSKAQFTLNVLLDISLHPEDISAQRT